MITTENLQGSISSEQDLSGGNIYPRGENSYLHIKYAENEPVSDEEISDSINNWIGIYADNIPEDSTSYLKYQWYRIKGENGERGVPGPEGKSIVEISKVSSDGDINTYRITFSDATYYDFEIIGSTSKIEKILVNGVEVEIIDKVVNIEISNEVAISPTEPTTNESVWIKKGKNKLSNSNWEQGGINQNTGANMDYETRLRTINYIDIIPNIDYFISVEDENYCFLNIILYDENNNWVGNYLSIDSSLNGATTLKVVFPSNCSKIRLVIRHSDNTSITTTDLLSTIKPMLVQGSTKMPYEEFIEEEIMLRNNAGKFEKYSDVKINSTKPLQGELCIQQGRNKYNKLSSTDGIYLTSTGGIATSDNVSLSDYIDVEGGQSYTYSGITNAGESPHSAWYDSDFNYISSFKQATGINTIQAPSNASYVRFSIRIDNTDKDTFQFEVGTVAHDYESYVERKILTKYDETYDVIQNIVDINKKIKEFQEIIDEQLNSYYFLGLGEQIAQNLDLNDFKTAGTFFSPAASTTSTLGNTPQTTVAFKLVVEYVNQEKTRIRQTMYTNSLDCTTYVRYFNANWGSWHKLELTEVS